MSLFANMLLLWGQQSNFTHKQMTTSGCCPCGCKPKSLFVPVTSLKTLLGLFFPRCRSRLALDCRRSGGCIFILCLWSLSTRFLLSCHDPSIEISLHLFFFPLFFFPRPASRYLYADPLHCNMTYLFLRLLKDDLREYTYAARLAGLVYGIASGMNAILVSMVISPSPFEMGGAVGEGRSSRLMSVQGNLSVKICCILQSMAMLYFQNICLISLLEYL